MAQWFAAKAAAGAALVFFRMGDFYELFHEDAEAASEALGIALTHRGEHQGPADREERTIGPRPEDEDTQEEDDEDDHEQSASLVRTTARATDEGPSTGTGS